MSQYAEGVMGYKGAGGRGGASYALGGRGRGQPSLPGGRALHGSGQNDRMAAQQQHVNYMDRQASPGHEVQQGAHPGVHDDSEEYFNMSTTTQYSHGYHDSTGAITMSHYAEGVMGYKGAGGRGGASYALGGRGRGHPSLPGGRALQFEF